MGWRVRLVLSSDTFRPCFPHDDATVAVCPRFAAALVGLVWVVKGLLMASYKGAVIGRAIAALTALLRAGPASRARTVDAHIATGSDVCAAAGSAELTTPVPMRVATALHTILSDDAVLNKANGGTVNVSRAHCL